jgi:hypothetical protein
MLTPEQPQWISGLPANLNAAARDALEWLELIKRLNDAGRWPFSEPDSRAKLDACIDQLKRRITEAQAIYEAGRQAGLEQAAGVCSTLYATTGRTFDHRACADAILALKEKK